MQQYACWLSLINTFKPTYATNHLLIVISGILSNGNFPLNYRCSKYDPYRQWSFRVVIYLKALFLLSRALNRSYCALLRTYTVIRPDNVFSALHNNTEQRANIRAITFSYFALVFALLCYCHRLCDTENEQWASGVFNQRIATDYCDCDVIFKRIYFVKLQ